MDGPAEDILSLKQMPHSAVLLRRVSALALEAPQGPLAANGPNAMQQRREATKAAHDAADNGADPQ